MLNRETAYKLAGRKHHRDQQLIFKERLIRLKKTNEDSITRAVIVLRGQPEVVAQAQGICAVRVTYNLGPYSLRILEALLQAQGVQLDTSWFVRLQRALIHYAEETQLRNLRAPQRLIKNSNAAYMHSYEQHAHGDHDATPKELRDYK